jgi:hypothetical protein
MKEVVLQKDLPYLAIDVAAGSLQQSLGPYLADTPMTGHFVLVGTGINALFVHQDTIDIAGMTNMELTFFPTSGDVQRSATSLGPTEGVAIEWILVTRSPIDLSGQPEQVYEANPMTFALPGQFSNGGAFENIIWGQGWTWVRNTSLIQNFAVAVNSSLLGSGEPTNGDKLYVYRIIRLSGPTDPGLAEFGSARLLISGQLREEAEYQQLMRMRRTYELQQSYDED